MFYFTSLIGKALIVVFFHFQIVTAATVDQRMEMTESMAFLSISRRSLQRLTLQRRTPSKASVMRHHHRHTLSHAASSSTAKQIAGARAARQSGGSPAATQKTPGAAAKPIAGSPAATNKIPGAATKTVGSALSASGAKAPVKPGTSKITSPSTPKKDQNAKPIPKAQLDATNKMVGKDSCKTSGRSQWIDSFGARNDCNPPKVSSKPLPKVDPNSNEAKNNANLMAAAKAYNPSRYTGNGMTPEQTKVAQFNDPLAKAARMAKVKQDMKPKNDKEFWDQARKKKKLREDVAQNMKQFTAEINADNKSYNDRKKSLDSIQRETVNAYDKAKGGFKKQEDQLKMKISRAKSDLAGAKTQADRDKANKALTTAQGSLNGLGDAQKKQLGDIYNTASSRMDKNKAVMAGDVGKIHGKFFNSKNEAKYPDAGQQALEAIGGMAEVMSFFVPGVGEVDSAASAVGHVVAAGIEGGAKAAGKVIVKEAVSEGLNQAKSQVTKQITNAIPGGAGQDAAKTGAAVGFSLLSGGGKGLGKAAGGGAASVAKSVATSAVTSGAKKAVTGYGKMAGTEVVKQVTGSGKKGDKKPDQSQPQSQAAPTPPETIDLTKLRPDWRNAIKLTDDQMGALKKNNDEAKDALDAQSKDALNNLKPPTKRDLGDYVFNGNVVERSLLLPRRIVW